MNEIMDTINFLFIFWVDVNHHQYIKYAFHGYTLCEKDDGILSTILILFRANENVKNGNMCEQQWQYVTSNNGRGAAVAFEKQLCIRVSDKTNISWIMN